MGEAITALRQPAISIPHRLLQLIPGAILLAVIRYADKITEQSIAAYGNAHRLTLRFQLNI